MKPAENQTKTVGNRSSTDENYPNSGTLNRPRNSSACGNIYGHATLPPSPGDPGEAPTILLGKPVVLERFQSGPGVTGSSITTEAPLSNLK
jgi:hypothetical protein